MNQMVDRYREWDAAYVLGALSTDERREFERHLATCDACQNGVAELAGMPGLLMKIDATTAEALVSDVVTMNEFVLPLAPIQSLAHAAIKRKTVVRRRLAAGMAVAASVVMVIGLLVGVNIGSSSNSGNTQNPVATTGMKVAMVPIGSNAMVVNMHVTKKAWGTQFAWNCVYGSDSSTWSTPQAYDLVITDATGVSTTVATWSQSGSSAKGLVASTGIPLSKIKTIDVRYSNSDSPVVRGQI